MHIFQARMKCECIRSWLDLVVLLLLFVLHRRFFFPWSLSTFSLIWPIDIRPVWPDLNRTFIHSIIRAFICVSVCFFRLFSLFHHAHKYERNISFFSLCIYIVLGCFWYTDFFFSIHFDSLYLHNSFLFSCGIKKYALLVVNYFVPVDKYYRCIFSFYCVGHRRNGIVILWPHASLQWNFCMQPVEWYVVCVSEHRYFRWLFQRKF